MYLLKVMIDRQMTENDRYTNESCELSLLNTINETFL